MTLILTLGDKDNVVHVSDRRLSSDGKLIDDESNKSGIVLCLNARMAFSYTGLAKWNSFSTFDWLLKALYQSAEPEFTIGEILERVRAKATETFQNDQRLKNAPKVNKKLTMMFSGFIDVDGYFKPGYAILSNYINFQTSTAYDLAQDEFQIKYAAPTKGIDNPIHFQRIGYWSAITDADVSGIRDFLSQGKPGHAICEKAFDFVRNIADREKSANSIGKQLMGIIIPSDLTQSVGYRYSTNIVKPETYSPSVIVLTPGQRFSIKSVSIKPLEKDTPPLSVPKVGRNVPCPCGSKKKYKHCHGKKIRRH